MYANQPEFREKEKRKSRERKARMKMRALGIEATPADTQVRPDPTILVAALE